MMISFRDAVLVTIGSINIREIYIRAIKVTLQSVKHLVIFYLVIILKIGIGELNIPSENI